MFKGFRGVQLLKKGVLSDVQLHSFGLRDVEFLTCKKYGMSDPCQSACVRPVLRFLKTSATHNISRLSRYFVKEEQLLWEQFSRFNSKLLGGLSQRCYCCSSSDEPFAKDLSSVYSQEKDCSDGIFSNIPKELTNRDESITHNRQAVTDHDVDNELLRYDYENFEDVPDEQSDALLTLKKPLPVSMKRGKTGVFDVEELVALLEDEKAQDIRILPVPPEYHYVDYMVVATGRSTRHLRAMAEFIKWMYKRKHSPNDPPSVRIEGEQSKDWFAMDLGNIAVHLFLHHTRLHYDLETLWTVGYTPDTDSVTDEVAQREDFSFDAELERLRKLKEARRESDFESNKNSPTVKPNMESFGNWHMRNDT